MSSTEGGVLRVVATPIGNLDDVSVRTIAALRGADLVLAEDTRHTGRLLARLGVESPQLSYHEHNERERVGEIVRRLRGGETVALVSDAGTPAVSDPGYRLVRACLDAGLRVEPVPGPSAALAALVVAGLPTDRFTFEGFLPRKASTRRERLEELAAEPRTMVLFVSPHRASADLTDLAAVLGQDRPATLARELTKLHEDVVPGTLATLAAHVQGGVRGELTLVVGGAPEQAAAALDAATLASRVRELVATGMTKKEATAAVARATGVPKREVYQAVLDAGS